MTATPELDLQLDSETYRRVDAASKLCGVVLLAAGFQAGGGTPRGLALAALGVGLATITVFVTEDP